MVVWNLILILTLFVVTQGYVTIPVPNPRILPRRWPLCPFCAYIDTSVKKSRSLHAKKKGDDENHSSESSSSSPLSSNNTKNSSNTNNPKKKKKKISFNDKLGKKNPSLSTKNNILSLLSNPYQAGKSLRQTLDDAFTSLGPKLTSTSSSSSSSSKAISLNDPLSSSSSERSVYYLDDRFLESSSSTSTNTRTTLTSGALASFAQRSYTNPYLLESTNNKVSSSSSSSSTYIPEVLVIGATTALGQTIVQRLLLLQHKFRVRVLVRDLYSKTLNMLGTGVTYCQGNLLDVDSLEYALTDVDKIIFVQGAPRQDEDNFHQAFDDFVQENLIVSSDDESNHQEDQDPINHYKKRIKRMENDLEYQSQIITLRAKLAQQVDCIGMKNLIQAYHNVRHADYGTSQVAKRTLFKFKESGKKDDFQLFTLLVVSQDNNNNHDDDDGRYNPNNNHPHHEPLKREVSAIHDGSHNVDGSSSSTTRNKATVSTSTSTVPNQIFHSGGTTTTSIKSKDFASNFAGRGSSSSQAMWIKNKFGHGVFTGRVKGTHIPTSSFDSSSSIISSRLRSRESPEKGIDLSNGFAGLILRICSDGKKYQVFIRTSLYESDGIEFVCEFSTASKIPQEENKSMNKFVTVRLPFTRFVPKRGHSSSNEGSDTVDSYIFPPFRGNDIRNIGFRFHMECTSEKEDTLISAVQRRRWTKFYLGISYIKAYRTQADPEFFYLSDARLPPVIGKEMVRHDLHRIVFPSDNNDSMIATSMILDEKELKRVIDNPKDRSEEELYYKFMGEEIIKNSGLCYTIARIAELNELPSGEFSTVRLNQSGTEITSVSRAEVADVCVSALLDPNASNLCFYVSKGDPPVDILQVEKTSKFDGLIRDFITQS